MSKKVVLATVNGVLCIDPSDVGKVNLVDIKARLREKYGTDIPVNVAPISTWMPDCGTEALMEEAMQKMAAKCLENGPKMVYNPLSYNNRHARRARERELKKRIK